MDPTADLGTPFPLPPVFYKKYDQKSMDKLKPHLKFSKTKTTSELKISETKEADKSTLIPSLKNLLPPAVPENCTEYVTFGRLFKLNEKFPPLEELKIKLLYTTHENTELFKEIKGLNRSVLFQFQELVVNLVNQAASDEPENELQRRIEKIHLTFVNLMHMLNRLRPTQARETLSLVIQKRTEYFQTMAENLTKKSENVDLKLQEHYMKFKRKSTLDSEITKKVKSEPFTVYSQKSNGSAADNSKRLESDPYLQSLINSLN